MLLGIGTWSGGWQARNSWHCGNDVSSVPPTPALSPKERENYRPRGDKARPPAISRDDRQSTLSLGERERPSPTLAYRAHPGTITGTPDESEVPIGRAARPGGGARMCPVLSHPAPASVFAEV